MPWKDTKTIPANVTDVDLARLSAFIDGEEHIAVLKYRTKDHARGFRFGYHLKVEVANTDPRLMVWLRRFEVGSFYLHKERPCKGRNRRTAYRWSVRSSEAVALLNRCLPFFVMKRDQAELAIAFGGVTANRHRKNIGTKFTPKEISDRDELVARMKELRIPPTQLTQ